MQKYPRYYEPSFPVAIPCQGMPKRCDRRPGDHIIEYQDSLSFPSGTTYQKRDYKLYVSRRFPWEPTEERKPEEGFNEETMRTLNRLW